MLETINIQCPYCGESIEILIDCSICEQTYIEDCSVCCRPISLQVHLDEEGRIKVWPRHENDAC